ncbi:hypothetical protein A2814_03155 [Candidatus Nomurabacteria bacterium RIFCSPHIGHO2_01_FULL_38_19]|uniref:Copper resistance protein D domain-containing protein n=1 Tax=Candidatus Nomurabacteria bacterium RIFCSPHIGHO2_01_FULL_38_19 TaxID=1801732 RepID=A0A1F6UQ62_9BACT|nr:MAG: hypothetical protein A2814_03155 [Candidatus Nomurabacteria bacterium RIFCSPHIGHO2_01_FULL_38_19]
MELIWGIQLNEVLLLLKQIGLAILGAAALWGFIFSIRDIRRHEPKTWIVDDWLSIKLFNLFLIGIILSSLAFFASLPTLRVLAHEGIAVIATISEITATFPSITILYIGLISMTCLMMILRIGNQEKFSYLLTPFYAIAFLMAFTMTSLSAWRGTFDSIQIFHFMHGFHSIFTLGSVIVLDFLFLTSNRSSLLKQHVYSLFPTISKVIWAGLALDFISVFLISEYFIVTEKFLFVQTVITILIINGVLLSGSIARKMMNSIKNHVQPITARWRRLGNIAGALSITSWITITTLDFFKNLTLSYIQLLLVYLGFFMLAFIGHLLFEHLESKKTPLTLSNQEI